MALWHNGTYRKCFWFTNVVINNNKKKTLSAYWNCANKETLEKTTRKMIHTRNHHSYQLGTDNTERFCKPPQSAAAPEGGNLQRIYRNLEAIDRELTGKPVGNQLWIDKEPTGNQWETYWESTVDRQRPKVKQIGNQMEPARNKQGIRLEPLRYQWRTIWESMEKQLRKNEGTRLTKQRTKR